MLGFGLKFGAQRTGNDCLGLLNAARGAGLATSSIEGTPLGGRQLAQGAPFVAGGSTFVGARERDGSRHRHRAG